MTHSMSYHSTIKNNPPNWIDNSSSGGSSTTATTTATRTCTRIALVLIPVVAILVVIVAVVVALLIYHQWGVILPMALTPTSSVTTFTKTIRVDCMVLVVDTTTESSV